jgi:hypothetical protein
VPNLCGIVINRKLFQCEPSEVPQERICRTQLSGRIQDRFRERKLPKDDTGRGIDFPTYNAMEEVNRPEGDEAWKFYDSSLKIAWKTGTSFGNRDAWAIGTSSRYVVGVWVGNATGEGRLNSQVFLALHRFYSMFSTCCRGKMVRTAAQRSRGSRGLCAKRLFGQRRLPDFEAAGSVKGKPQKFARTTD